MIHIDLSRKATFYACVLLASAWPLFAQSAYDSWFSSSKERQWDLQMQIIHRRYPGMGSSGGSGWSESTPITGLKSPSFSLRELLGLPKAKSDFQKAIEKYNRGEVGEALVLLERAALDKPLYSLERGKAALALGRIHDSIDVSLGSTLTGSSREKAYTWYLAAIENKETEAYWPLAVHCDRIGKYQEALQYYEKAIALRGVSDYNKAYARRRSGEIIFAGKGVQRDELRARSLWREASTLGDQKAQEYITNLEKGDPLLNLRYDFACAVSEDGLAAVWQDNKWGYADSRGNEVIAPRFAYAGNFVSGRAIVNEGGRHEPYMPVKGGRWKVIDKQGNTIRELPYDWMMGFSEGLAEVNIGGAINSYGAVKGGKNGYINQAGDEVIPLEYEYAFPFKNGMAHVSGSSKSYVIDKTGTILYELESAAGHPLYKIIKNGKYGLLNVDTDEILIEPLYEDMGLVRDGRVSVNVGGTRDDRGYIRGGKWGIVDVQGKIITEPSFDFIKPVDNGAGYEGYNSDRSAYKDNRWQGKFYNGYALINVGGYPPACDICKPGGGRWGMVDEKGNEIIPARYDYLDFLFRDGLLVFNVGGKSFQGNVAKGGKWGLVNKLGIEVVPARYDYIDPIPQNGLFRVRLGGTIYRDQYTGGGKWGFVNTKGEEAILPAFEYAYHFSQGIARVNRGGRIEGNKPAGMELIEGGEWAYIDSTGKIILDFRPFDFAGDFYDGLAPAAVNGKYGYIDKSGAFVIKPRYAAAGRFSLHNENHPQLAPVKAPGENGKWGYINRQGKLVIDFLFDDEGTGFYSGMCGVSLNGKYVTIDSNGRVLK